MEGWLGGWRNLDSFHIVAYTEYGDDQVAGFYRGEGLNNQGDSV